MPQPVTVYNTEPKQSSTAIEDTGLGTEADTCNKAPVRSASSSQGSSRSLHNQQSTCPSRPPSQRQACKGTFKRILQQQRQEDQAFADFEAALKLGKITSLPAPTPASPVVTEGGVVKKRRGRPPKPRPLVPVRTRPLLCGPHLASVLHEVRTIKTRGMPQGTAVWVKVMGYCAWPGLTWSLDLCARATWPDIIRSYLPGKLLVRYYGEHSSSWVAPKQLMLWEDSSEADKIEALKAWGKKANRTKLVSATLDEVAGRADSREEELNRMARMGRTYQLDHLQAAARERHGALLHPSSTTPTAATNISSNLADDSAVVDSSMNVSGRSCNAGAVIASVAPAAPATAAAAHGSEVVRGNPWGACDVCREEVPNMRCCSCRRWLHALCCSPAALVPEEYPTDKDWTCPACGAANKVKVLPEDEFLHQAAGAGTAAERMGLTPDWIITTAAFKVFRLAHPTPERPYIAGLLDPACNSKLDPNIPAEVLFDKKDDGLKAANSWAGYHIILNPDFRAQVQWKFVNRAIDEVENGNVPAVLLICRNSTDTAYFQRLRPYPRVLLRRSSAQFKDYDKSPIGFGVVVFCVAKSPCQDLYQRFYEGFAMFGEPNIPIDKEFMSSGPFYQLLDRLRRHAEQYARDHWVQCSACGVWRIITYQQLHALQGDATDWSCSKLRPPHTSCATPQSKAELAGMHHVPVIAAASQPVVPVDTAEETCTQTLALASMLDDHQDPQPKSSGLLPALQEALRQQAALAAAAASGLDATDPPAKTGFTQLPGKALNALGEGGRIAPAASVADDDWHAPTADDGAQPATAPAAVAALRRTAEEGETSVDASEAADVLRLLGAVAGGVKCELGMSYLIKSAAGQISSGEARQLMQAAAEEHDGAPQQQHEQQHEQQQQYREQQTSVARVAPDHAPAVAAAASAPVVDCDGNSSAEDEAMGEPAAAHSTAGMADAAGTPAFTSDDVSTPDAPRQCSPSSAAKRKHSVSQTQQQQEQCPTQKLRQSSRLKSRLKRSREDAELLAEGSMQQQEQQQQHQDSLEILMQPNGGVHGVGGEVIAADTNKPPSKQRRTLDARWFFLKHKVQPKFMPLASIPAAAASSISLSPTADQQASAAAAAAAAPAVRDQACQTAADLVPNVLRSQGLRHLADAVHKLLDKWLLVLVHEQLAAWEKRQQLIKQVVWREELEVQQQEEGMEEKQQHLSERQQQQLKEHRTQHQQQQQKEEEQEKEKEEPLQHAVCNLAVHETTHDLALTSAKQLTAPLKVRAAVGAVSEDTRIRLEDQSPVGKVTTSQQQQAATAPLTDSTDRLTGEVCEEAVDRHGPAASPTAAALIGSDQESQHCLAVTADAAPESLTAAAPVATDLNNPGGLSTCEFMGIHTPEQQRRFRTHPDVHEQDFQSCTQANGSQDQLHIAPAAAAELQCTSRQQQQRQQEGTNGTLSAEQTVFTAFRSESLALSAAGSLATVATAAPVLEDAAGVSNTMGHKLCTPAAAAVEEREGEELEVVTHPPAATPAGQGDIHTSASRLDLLPVGGCISSYHQDVIIDPPAAAAATARVQQHVRLTAGLTFGTPHQPLGAAAPGGLAVHDVRTLLPQFALLPVAPGAAPAAHKQAMLPQHMKSSIKSLQRQQQQHQHTLHMAPTPVRPMVTWPNPQLQQQHQQYVLVKTVMPSSAVPTASVPQLHLVTLPSNALHQQQQSMQFQLQWQLAQAAILQQMQQQQLLRCAGAATPRSAQSGAAAAMPVAQSTQSPAAASKYTSSQSLAHFDAEKLKRTAGQRARQRAASIAAVEELARATSEVISPQGTAAEQPHGSGSATAEVQGAAFLAALPQGEADDPQQTDGQKPIEKLGPAAAPAQGKVAETVLAAEQVGSSSMPSATTVVSAAVADPAESAVLDTAVTEQQPQQTNLTNTSSGAEGAVGVSTAQIAAAAAAAAAGSVHQATAATAATGSPDIDEGPVLTDNDDTISAAPTQPLAPPIKQSVLLQVAPVCLSQGKVLSLTDDPLLRAVLLEQPAMMRAVLGLLQQICLFKQKQRQQFMKQQQQLGQDVDLDGSLAQSQQLQRAAVITAPSQGLPPALPAAAKLVSDSLELPRQHPAQTDQDIPLFDLHCPGSDLICWDTLDRLANQPSSSTWCRKHQDPPRRQQGAAGGQHSDQVDEDKDTPTGDDVAGVDGVQSVQDHGDDETSEFMSSLALARQTRVAANRAYLRGLGLGPSAIQSGLINSLPPDHMAMVAAARQIAKQAAIKRAEQQVYQRQRVLDARRAVRRAHEAQLRSALQSLTVDEAQAQQLVWVAQQTLEDVKHFAG